MNDDTVVITSETPDGNLQGNFQKLLNSKLRLTIFVLIFGVLGTILLIFSSASEAKLETPVDPNTIIVQFSLPHVIAPTSSNNLPASVTPPFSLYGNGLLVCGKDNATPFASGNIATDGVAAGLPTSTTLTSQQVRTLIQEVRDTGFFNLEPEYYKRPISESMETLRVSLLSGEHYVMYYNDVPPPPAYTQAVAILQKYCQNVTTPYQAETVILRTLKNADPKGQAPKSSATLDASVRNVVKKGLGQANLKYGKPQAAADIIDSPVTTAGEASQTITGNAAKDLLRQQNGKSRQFVQENGSTYEVGVDPKLPQIKNTLSVDYDAVRAKKGQKDGLSAKVHNLVVPAAHAATTPPKIPVRVVLLLPKTGGDTSKLPEAQAIGQKLREWYCAEVSSCYTYNGPIVMRGSQTMQFYNTCRNSYNWCNGDVLNAVLTNVADKDVGTIYRSDVDTLIVTGWSTGANTHYCGWGFIGGNLSIADYYRTNCYLHAATSGHELGHTFGLNHTGNGSLMDGSPYAQYAPYCDIASIYNMPNCWLDFSQANWLRASGKFFGPDVIQPSIHIDYPATGSTISGQVNILASAYDKVGVTKVTFYYNLSSGVGNTTTLATDTTAPYSYVWDTSNIPPGTYNILAFAYDAAGNAAEAVSYQLNVTAPAPREPVQGVD